jgi:hypothetical protein
MKTFIFLLFVTLAIVSCQKDEQFVKYGNDKLIGNWINPQYRDTLVTYSRAVNLIENEIGITFKPGYKFVYRQNSSWCGTPPITTADYEGAWNWNDSTIDISVGYWGGTANYSWKVITLSDKKLVISVVKTSYQEEK